MLSIGMDESVREQVVSKKYGSTVFEYITSLEQGKIPEKIDGENSPTSCWDGDMAEEFWFPNVSRCLQLCDVHLYNDRSSGNYNDLRAQVCWYLSLMLHPGLFTPKSSERVMNIAFQAKLSSGCLSRQIGAVVTNADDDVLSIGWNDVPKGQTPCILRSVHGCFTCTSDDRDYSEYEKQDVTTKGSIKNKLQEKYSDVIRQGDKIKSIVSVKWNHDVELNYCFKDTENTKSGKKESNQVHTRAVHAEENAMLQIGKMSPVPPERLYTTASPCVLCAKKAAEINIKEIIFVDPYTDISMTHNLRYHNSPRLIQFYGAVKNGYQKLYTPKLPMKNELEFLHKKNKN